MCTDSAVSPPRTAAVALDAGAALKAPLQLCRSDGVGQLGQRVTGEGVVLAQGLEVVCECVCVCVRCVCQSKLEFHAERTPSWGLHLCGRKNNNSLGCVAWQN